jgi:hypothetical protein
LIKAIETVLNSNSQDRE